MTENDNAFVKMYHTFPDGTYVQVTIPLPVDRSTDGKAIAAMLVTDLTALFDAGFKANAPDQKPGQMVEEVGSLIIGEKTNERGTSYVVAYYPTNEALVYRAYGKHYLDSAEDIAEFENATGLKIANLTNLWPSAEFPKRDDAKAARYFYKLAKPIRVGFEHNSRYNPEETDVSKKKPQYVWSGYVGVPNASKPAQNAPAASSPDAGKSAVSDDTFGKLVDGIFGNREHGRAAFKKLMDLKIINKKTMSQDKQLVILDAYHQLRENGKLSKDAVAKDIETQIAAYIEAKHQSVEDDRVSDVDFINDEPERGADMTNI